MPVIPDNDWNFEPLTNDAMFHLVFLNNEKARTALVSTLLNIPEKEIKKITVMNPIQFSDAFDASQTVLDLRLHLVNGLYLNIEMQVRRFSEWTNRTIVYSCRQMIDQSNREGFVYGKLEPVIHIAIMSHTLFEDHRRFFAKYELKDETGYRYSDKLQFLVMDLKAISEATEDERKQGLVEWAQAFTARDWEQIRKIENAGVREAVKQMQTVMSTPEQRQMIWSRRLAQLDRDSQLTSARAEGRAEGKAEGRAEGRTEGRTEGENNLGQLMSELLLSGRIQDASRAAVDAAYRKELYAEFGISTSEVTDES